jgi:curli biogenesis system outer membrane secretion channel CsgG
MTMKKTMLNLVLGLMSFAAYAADLPAVAVVDFTANEYTLLQKKFPDLLEEKIINSGLFQVVERDKLESAVKEMGYTQSGMVDPQSAVAMGKHLGARYLVTGKIVDCGQETRRFNGYGTSTRTTYFRLSVNVKVVDAERGLAVASISKEAERPLYESKDLRVSGSGIELALARDLAESVMRDLRNAEFVKAHKPQAKSMAGISIHTVPEGADVTIDGVYHGNAGGPLQVEAGHHEIVVSLPGYESWRQTVACRDGLAFTARLKQIKDPDLAVKIQSR